MIQQYATTRRAPVSGQAAGIRRRASYLPQIYAERSAQELETERFEVEKEQFERNLEQSQVQFEEQSHLAQEGMQLQKKQAKEGERVAKAGVGITAGTVGIKAMDMYKDSPTLKDSWYSSEYGDFGLSDVGTGVSGGLTAAGLASGLGAKKKWQTTAAGIAGGTALSYLSGGDDPLSMIMSGLIGGGMGMLF